MDLREGEVDSVSSYLRAGAVSYMIDRVDRVASLASFKWSGR